MKTYTRFNLWFVAIFLLATGLEFIGIKIDLFLNRSWLEEGLGQWQWWNYFTSDHSMTVLYLQGSNLWLLAPFIIAIIFATRAALDE